MLDFDISKMLVVAIVALAVIPPKDLPRVMRTVGQVMGRMRRMAAEFQGQFMDAMREAEFESVRKELAELNQKATQHRRDEPDDGRELRPGGHDPRRGDQGRRAARASAGAAGRRTGAEIGTSEVALGAPRRMTKPAARRAAHRAARRAKSSAAE